VPRNLPILVSFIPISSFSFAFSCERPFSPTGSPPLHPFSGTCEIAKIAQKEMGESCRLSPFGYIPASML
jgi:hypothetical protein